MDSSIWIDYVRSGNDMLASKLQAGRVFIHPLVIGEVAMGDPRDFNKLIGMLSDLPRIKVVADSEVVQFVQQNKLFATGLGYIDTHLLVSVRLIQGAHLWTRDRRLHREAARLGVAASV